MSNQKSTLLTTVVALGLITATAAAAAMAYTNRKQQSGDTAAADKQRSAADRYEACASGTAADAPPAAPLTIAPAQAGSKVMVVCTQGSEEASVAEQWAAQSRAGGAIVGVCPPDLLDSHAKLNSGSYDSVVIEAGKGLGDAVLGEVSKLLKVGGKVNVALEEDGGGAAAVVKRALTFAGFLKVAPSAQDDRVFTGERAGWEAGASAPVRLSFGKPTATATVAAINGSQNGAASSNGNGSAATKTWKLGLDDDEDGGADENDDDLVDEDALLESSAPVKRASEADDGGCATKRRACKDCSCGRAEMEMSESNAPLPVVSVGDVDDALTSACGNCSKGDAFRCGGCPFLGKPAFEKGQEKTIMLSDLDSQQDD
ncbi:unnamed protein product [Pylaiella littoralis]